MVSTKLSWCYIISTCICGRKECLNSGQLNMTQFADKTDKNAFVQPTEISLLNPEQLLSRLPGPCSCPHFLTFSIIWLVYTSEARSSFNSRSISDLHFLSPSALSKHTPSNFTITSGTRLLRSPFCKKANTETVSYNRTDQCRSEITEKANC